MSELSRRSILHTGALILCGHLAGCNSQSSGNPTSSDPSRPATSPSPTETPNASPSPSSRETQTTDTDTNAVLSFEASMVQQASSDGPPQFKVVLSNEGDQEVMLQWGRALMWSTEAVYPEELVMVPADRENPDVHSTRFSDGCWEYTAEKKPPIPASATRGLLVPGNSLETRFAVFSHTVGGRCPPPGEYQMRDDIGVQSFDKPQELIVKITIDDAGKFSVEGIPRKITE